MKSGATLLRLMEKLDCGVAMLDGSGRVVGLNACAKRCLSSRFGRHGPADRQDDSSMTAALRELTAPLASSAGANSKFAAVPTASGRPLVIVTFDLGMSADYGIEKCVILIDLNENPQPQAEVLRQAFNLTKAEAKLAVRIASGQSLNDIAGAENVAVGTLRAQLKSILGKTHTHRQAELVALVMRLAIIP